MFPFLEAIVLAVGIFFGVFTAQIHRLIGPSLAAQVEFEQSALKGFNSILFVLTPVVTFASVVAAHFIMPFWFPVPAFFVVSLVMAPVVMHARKNPALAVGSMPWPALCALGASAMIIFRALAE